MMHGQKNIKWWFIWPTSHLPVGGTSIRGQCL